LLPAEVADLLHKISLGLADINRYRMVQSPELMDELIALGRELKGLRVCHINSTPYGGGVAELMVSHIPFLRSLGITADWQIIRGDRKFFSIAKKLHNALQGASYRGILDEESRHIYLNSNLDNASELDPNYDVFIVNDPPPAAILSFLPQSSAKWIWRCHVDSSQPAPEVWDFLKPFLELYDAAVFAIPEFIPADLKAPVKTVIPSVICPFSSKNMEIDKKLCRELIVNLGFDKEKRLMTQVARFDRWKDPMGVMEAFRLARKEIPDLQMAFVGSFAIDDPEGMEMHAALSAAALEEGGVMIFSNLTGVGNMEVNAFQRASDVIVQKSVREGFGLVVAEALWKETPVVAGNAGGIPSQMPGRLSEYLVDSVEEYAGKIVSLLKDPAMAAELGREGRENVRKNFLLPRYALDELKLIKSLL
jgi:trehalose synthase